MYYLQELNYMVAMGDYPKNYSQRKKIEIKTRNRKIVCGKEGNMIILHKNAGRMDSATCVKMGKK